MKTKFSLSELLRNDRLMMLLSLVLAIILWSLVVYGPGATDTKTITVPITVKLNSVAESGQNLPDQYFSVISKSADTVEITVSANRSVLAKLNADSLSVTADMSGIVNAVTDYEVPLEYKSNVSGAFTVTNISKNKIKVSCDYLGKNAYPISVDMSQVSIADESQYILGTPVSETTNIIISGPKETRDKIVSVKAVVPKTTGLTETTVVMAPLKALDAEGNEIPQSEWQYCSFEEFPEGEVPVTVIVQGHRKVTIAPKLVNVPEAYKNSVNFITIIPTDIEFRGVPETVDAFQSYLENFVLDFHQLNPEDGVCTVPLEIPEGITVIDGITALQVRINISSISTKKLEMTLDTNLKQSGTTWKSDNVTILNVPEGYRITLTQKKLSDIVLVGKSDSVSKLRGTNLKIVIDMQNKLTPGPLEYAAEITVSGSKTVWIYYGQNGYPIYLTTQAD